MVETFFKRPCTINRLRGPLAGHIDLLADRFVADGFSRVHSRIQIRLVGHFNRWLDQKRLSAQQIDEALIERYWRYFQRRKRVRWFDVSVLVRLSIDHGPIVVFVAIVIQVGPDHISSRGAAMRQDQTGQRETVPRVEQNVGVEVVPKIVFGIRTVRIEIVDVERVLAIEIALIGIVVSIYGVGVVEPELNPVAHAAYHTEISAIIAGVSDRLIDIDLSGRGIGTNHGSFECLAGGIHVNTLAGLAAVSRSLDQRPFRVDRRIRHEAVGQYRRWEKVEVDPALEGPG